MYNLNINEKDKIINQIKNSLFQKEKEIENKYNLILVENSNKIMEIKTILSLKTLKYNHKKDMNDLLNQKKKIQV
jgi:hypothetical protein